MIPQARFDIIEERGTRLAIPQSAEGGQRPDPDGRRLAVPDATVRVMPVRQIRSSMGAVVHVERSSNVVE